MMAAATILDIARRNHKGTKAQRKTPRKSFVISFVSWCLRGCGDVPIFDCECEK
jgi:hypothetical protein